MDIIARDPRDLKQILKCHADARERVVVTNDHKNGVFRLIGIPTWDGTRYSIDGIHPLDVTHDILDMSIQRISKSEEDQLTSSSWWLPPQGHGNGHWVV